MPIRFAHEIAWDSSPRCPECDDAITANGRHQPIAVDGEDRPYCRRHGLLAEPEYGRRLADYERRRKALGELVRDAQEHGVSPTIEELQAVRSEWEKA